MPDVDKFLKESYAVHASSNKSLNIPYHITEDEWVDWWKNCPFLEKRMSGRGQIRTARLDKTMHWTIDNLKAMLAGDRLSQYPAQGPVRIKQTQKRHFTPWYDSSRILTRSEWLSELAG